MGTTQARGSTTACASRTSTFDVETGKHYNYFRDLDPSIGRYIESDPMGLRAGFNTYAYVRNQPLRFFDPLGLRAQICCKKIPGLHAGHCFVNEVEDKDKTNCQSCPSQTRRVGLQGPWPLGSSSNGAGQVHTNDAFDQPGESTCGGWNSSCGVSKCIDEVIKSYPDPSNYSALGPNSNTFASEMSRRCGIPGAGGFGYPIPGWGQGPAGPVPNPLDAPSGG